MEQHGNLKSEEIVSNLVSEHAIFMFCFLYNLDKQAAQQHADQWIVLHLETVWPAVSACFQSLCSAYQGNLEFCLIQTHLNVFLLYLRAQCACPLKSKPCREKAGVDSWSPQMQYVSPVSADFVLHDSLFLTFSMWCLFQQ